MTPVTRHRATLGILGGMGPASTIDLLVKILAATPARCDQEHLPIVVRSIPQVPDRTAALLKDGVSPEDALVRGALQLRQAGAGVLAIACNTAHHWYDPIRQAFGWPVLHIGRAVLAELAARHCDGPVGLMATRGTLQSGFYRRYLEDAGYRVISPTGWSQRHEVDRAIGRVKAGHWHEARRPARRAAQALLGRGARTLILGCTELPLALRADPLPGLLDANHALARACVRAVLCDAKVTPHDAFQDACEPRGSSSGQHCGPAGALGLSSRRAK